MAKVTILGINGHIGHHAAKAFVAAGWEVTGFGRSNKHPVPGVRFVQGDADSVFVHQSSGYPALDSAAVDAVRTMRFRPGRRGDERVVAWVRLPVRFTRERAATLGTPEPSLP